MLNLLRLPREPPKHARIPAVPCDGSPRSRLRYAHCALDPSGGSAS